jgi:hypothetical protein
MDEFLKVVKKLREENKEFLVTKIKYAHLFSFKLFWTDNNFFIWIQKTDEEIQDDWNYVMDCFDNDGFLDESVDNE